MTRKIKGNLWLLLLVTAVGLSVVGFAASRVMRSAKATTPPIETQQNRPRVNRDREQAYVRRGLLSPRLVRNLNPLGNRLEKKGKERLTITGELHESGDAQARELAATLEFPDKLRLTLPQNRVLTFDPQQIKGGQLTAAADELDLIETLVYDSAEHFFASQMQGNAMRFLGARFRTDDGSIPDYDGPYFDVYKIADQIETSGQERAAKLYYFNSDTLLLERVTYVINRDGFEVNVETKLSDWRGAEGERVARRIERFENGKSVFVLTIRSTRLGRRADDGIFGQ